MVHLGLSACFWSYFVQWATHAAMLPSLFVAWRMGSGTFFGTGVATLATSLVYHVCEVMNHSHCYSGPQRLCLGMNDGRWHRLDNIFAIASLQLLCLYVADLPVRRSGREALNWLAFFVTLVFQEAAPWELANTIVPIVPCVLLAMLRVATGARVDMRLFSWGVVCLAPAVFFFYRGLDDERDYLRLWHGLWHVAINAAASCFAMSRWRRHREEKKSKRA